MAAASLELLGRIAPSLAAPVITALVEAAVGNPLALVELPATLTAGQRAGIAESRLSAHSGRTAARRVRRADW